MFTPAFTSISGRGKPRLLVVHPTNRYTSYAATTFTATTATEAQSATVAISDSHYDGRWIDTATPHGLSAGQHCWISGHSVAAVNGEQTVGLVPTTTRFSILTAFDENGTGGTVNKTPDFSQIHAGMRVVSHVDRTASALPKLPVYGRVTAVDAVNKVLTVSEWVNGQPTNGEAFAVNGWVIDLPHTKKDGHIQTFTPDTLIHHLWRSRIAHKWRGYTYACTLDWSDHIHADIIYQMEQALNLQEDDRLILVPRIDKPQWQYNVLQVGDITIQLFGRAPGHKGFRLQFIGTEPVAKLPIQRTGWGFAWGTLWGHSSS